MKGPYRIAEKIFERIAGIGNELFSNSIVFLLAILLIIYWFVQRDWSRTNVTDVIRDVMTALTFLGFFIIQKTFRHFSQALHLKINELIAAHENARNHVIGAEEKTEEELKELAKEHDKILKDTERDNKL